MPLKAPRLFDPIILDSHRIVWNRPNFDSLTIYGRDGFPLSHCRLIAGETVFSEPNLVPSHVASECQAILTWRNN